MADSNVEIPNRAAFKAAEVCEIAQIPTYVLRSWEKEFPRLGAAPRPGGPRTYTRGDVEQVLRIKQLVFAEGLTLAGARRRIEGDTPPEEDRLPEPDQPPPLSEEARTRLVGARRDLRSLLELLSQPAATWPPHKSAATEPNDLLPLLDGSPDRPPAPRATGRKAGRSRPTTKVE